jgi:DNA invertase Pin-like site-specific DNA recombinase
MSKANKTDRKPLVVMLLVAYYRVSTDKQGKSGLGLEAQRAAVRKYAAEMGYTIVAEFVEVETGKRTDRPELRRALADCKRRGATLAIAKLDRLTRNARFLLTLLEGAVDIVFCDLPQVPPGAMGKFFLTMMAAVAELEAGLISDRTKAALAAYVATGRVSKRVKLLYPDGVPPEVVEATAGKLGASLPQCRDNLTDAARAKGAGANRDQAVTAYALMVPLAQQLRAEGLSLRAIASRLNGSGHATRNGSAWSAPLVKRVLDRAARKA